MTTIYEYSIVGYPDGKLMTFCNVNNLSYEFIDGINTFGWYNINGSVPSQAVVDSTYTTYINNQIIASNQQKVQNLLSFNSSGNLSNSATQFLLRNGTNSTESNAQILITQNSTISKMVCNLSIIPTGIQSRSFILRKNGSNVSSCAITYIAGDSSNKTIENWSGYVDCVSGDLLSVISTCTNTPVASTIRLSITFLSNL